MATTTNYLGVLDGLSIYDTDGDRQDVTAYPAIGWNALNANLRVTDTPNSILDIIYYGLEVLPTNPDPVTLYIHNVPMDDVNVSREMLFHCQVKCSVDVQTTTSLYETGQPIGDLVPIEKSCPREQFTAIRSNLLPLSKGGSVTTHTFTYQGAEITHTTFGTRYATITVDIENHAGNIIYVTIPALINHLDFYKNSFVRSARNYIPDVYWRLDFEQSDPQYPMYKLLDALTNSSNDVMQLFRQIENSYYGQAAGTREAMTSAVQRVLSGNKSVAIIPHYANNAWKIQVQTLRAETQDFDASTYVSDDVLDVVAQASPMGYEIFHMAVLFFAFTLGNVGLGRLGLGVLGGVGGYVPPDAPTGLTISAGGTPSTQLTLTWVAPAYNGGNVISGYVIRRDGSIIVANTGNTNVTYTNTSLLPGTTYSYTVAAINGAGAGDQSSSASGGTDPIVADAPTSLTASAGTTPSSMIDLSWTTPVYDGGAAVIGYQITENRAGAGDVVIVSNTGSTATTYARTGLDRVISYAYKVKAINSAGVGAVSNTATLTTAAELPGAPTGLTLTAGSPANTVISLAWTVPADTGGVAISGYRIKRNGSTIVSDTGSATASYSATGLTQDTSYTFNVAAINSAGTGGDSTTETRSTLPTGIGATGGTINYYTIGYNNYKSHTFTADGTFEITSNLSGALMDFMIVGGGAAGSATSSGIIPTWEIIESAAGGGGGGGVWVETNEAGTVQTYAVVVGDGGAIRAHGQYGYGGDDSSLGSYVQDTTNGKGGSGGSPGGAQNTGNGGSSAAGGGGGGGTWMAGGSLFNVSAGGSNGGSGGSARAIGGDGGDGAINLVGSVRHATGGGGGGSYGNDGGNGVLNGVYSHGGVGGDGLANNFSTGSDITYGGGGGAGLAIGGNNYYGSSSVGGGSGASGGAGGGGTGGVSWQDTNSAGDPHMHLHTATGGTDGLGGGGGSEAWGGGTTNAPIGTTGGSGVVVVRYQVA
jgi:hypothetical protein